MTTSKRSGELVAYLKKMVEIRRFEERVLELYAEGEIKGMCHLCMGQEAVAVGACSCVTPDDYIVSTHRGHGHLLAKGGKPDRMMAELFGRETGYCKGRGGSMHIADVDVGHLGANGIVGGGIPISCGAGFAIKYKGEKRVVLSFFGDGATCQGSFHESLNMAALWNLPIVFVCENNHYAVSTHIDRSCPTPNIADKADAYAIDRCVVDGMDVLAVQSAVARAVKKARAGKGPVFVECKTYSFQGHGTNNDRPYRTSEEEAAWWTKCPINRLKDRLIRMSELTERKFSNLDKRIRTIIESAVEFARESPYPAAEDVGANMFAD